MFPLVQSLPELLHNKLKVIELLLTQLKLCEAIVVTTYVKLVSALARYYSMCAYFLIWYLLL